LLVPCIDLFGDDKIAFDLKPKVEPRERDTYEMQEPTDHSKAILRYVIALLSAAIKVKNCRKAFPSLLL
jgi:hypothetical protein